jgi:hypothetical protein
MSLGADQRGGDARRSQFARLISLGALFGVFMGVSAFGICDEPVVVPPNDGGGTPLIDDDPANPANWVIGPAVKEGLFHMSRVELKTGGPRRVPYDFPWTPPPPSGGPVVAPPAIPTPPFSQIYGSDDVIIDTAGTVTRTIHWIGEGDAPPQVIVRVKSYTMVTWAHGLFAGGEGEVNNGLDGMPVDHLEALCPDPIIDTPTWELRVLDVNSTTGNATLAVSCSAHVRGGGSQAAVWAAAGQLDVQIDDRTVGLVIGGEDNFHKGYPNGTVPYNRIIHYYVDPTQDADGTQWRIDWNNGIKDKEPPRVQCASSAKTETQQYPKVLPVLNRPVYTTGLTSYGILDRGLTAQYQQIIWTLGSSEANIIPSSVDPTHVSYVGSATSKGVPEELFRYTIGTYSLLGVLPDSGCWDIPAAQKDYTCKLITTSITEPQRLAKSFTLHEEEGDSNTSEEAKFEYRWHDGTRGVATRPTSNSLWTRSRMRWPTGTSKLFPSQTKRIGPPQVAMANSS